MHVQVLFFTLNPKPLLIGSYCRVVVFVGYGFFGLLYEGHKSPDGLLCSQRVLSSHFRNYGRGIRNLTDLTSSIVYGPKYLPILFFFFWGGGRSLYNQSIAGPKTQVELLRPQDPILVIKAPILGSQSFHTTLTMDV